MKGTSRGPSIVLRREKQRLPDFGTYHHSTPGGSVVFRDKIKVTFTEAFRLLQFSRDEKIRVLDVGCGLGFISCTCAEFYRNARVVGFDTFEHLSLRGSSLSKAKKNAAILGFSDRVRFRKGDVFDSDYRRGKFDLLVSNLVFHNFGKKRFDAYDRLASWVHPNSYVIFGDLMFHAAADLKHLSNLFKTMRTVRAKGIGDYYRMLVMSQPE